ncbi:MAG: SH3 domain-containing protein [Caldilineaceae bacterium]
MIVTLRRFIRLLDQGIVHKGVIALVIVVLLLSACGRGGAAEVTPTVAATPAAGGMVMPTAATPTVAAATPTVAASTPTAVMALEIGTSVQAALPEGVRLYSDATHNAVVMGLYPADALFTVLDPSGDYADYPVEQGGLQWYRLRAADGLVGWAPADAISAAH